MKDLDRLFKVSFVAGFVVWLASTAGAFYLLYLLTRALLKYVNS